METHIFLIFINPKLQCKINIKAKNIITHIWLKTTKNVAVLLSHVCLPTYFFMFLRIYLQTVFKSFFLLGIVLRLWVQCISSFFLILWCSIFLNIFLHKYYILGQLPTSCKQNIIFVYNLGFLKKKKSILTDLACK